LEYKTQTKGEGFCTLEAQGRPVRGGKKRPAYNKASNALVSTAIRSGFDGADHFQGGTVMFH
jgi:hypothetical protein